MIDLLPERKYKFIHNKEEYSVIRSRHLYEERGKSGLPRDYILDKSRYIDIFKLAIKNGLKSFKKEVVVTLPTDFNTHVSLLCEYKDKEIFVISMFVSYRDWWKSFIKCRNRINILHDYKIQSMSKVERGKKRMDCIMNKVDLEIQKEIMNFNPKLMLF